MAYFVSHREEGKGEKREKKGEREWRRKGERKEEKVWGGKSLALDLPEILESRRLWNTFADHRGKRTAAQSNPIQEFPLWLSGKEPD